MIFRCILKCVFYHDLWQNVVSKSWICPLCFRSGNPQPRRRPIDFEAEVAGKHIPAEVSEISWTQKCPNGICDRFPGGFWLLLSWPECPYRLIRSQKWVLLALLWWLLPSGGGWSWALVCDFAAACIDDVFDIVWCSCNLVLVNDRRQEAVCFFWKWRVTGKVISSKFDRSLTRGDQTWRFGEPQVEGPENWVRYVQGWMDESRRIYESRKM